MSIQLAALYATLQPFLIPLASVLVPALGLFLMHDQGSAVMTLNVKLMDKGAALGLSYTWGQNKTITIVYAHVAVTVGFKFGDFLIVPMKQVQQMPTAAQVQPTVSAAPVVAVAPEPTAAPNTGTAVQG